MITNITNDLKRVMK